MTSRTVASVAKRDIDFADLSIATVGGLALALIAMFLCVVPLAGNITSGRDFVVFWATGQQLIHHANPYDAAAIGQIERAAGLNPGYGILFMRNPPWALPLVLPLGLVGLRVGALLWSLVLSRQSHSLAHAFLRAGTDLLFHGPDFAFRSARVGSVSSSASHAPIHGRAHALALRAQAPPVSTLRRCASSLGDRYKKL